MFCKLKNIFTSGSSQRNEQGFSERDVDALRAAYISRPAAIALKGRSPEAAAFARACANLQAELRSVERGADTGTRQLFKQYEEAKKTVDLRQLGEADPVAVDSFLRAELALTAQPLEMRLRLDDVIETSRAFIADQSDRQSFVLKSQLV